MEQVSKKYYITFKSIYSPHVSKKLGLEVIKLFSC